MYWIAVTLKTIVNITQCRFLLGSPLVYGTNGQLIFPSAQVLTFQLATVRHPRRCSAGVVVFAAIFGIRGHPRVDSRQVTGQGRVTYYGGLDYESHPGIATMAASEPTTNTKMVGPGGIEPLRLSTVHILRQQIYSLPYGSVP